MDNYKLVRDAGGSFIDRGVCVVLPTSSKYSTAARFDEKSRRATGWLFSEDRTLTRGWPPRARRYRAAVRLRRVRSGALWARASRRESRPENRHDGTRITEYGGFFLFEQVPDGTYGLRVAADGAQVLGVERELAGHYGLSRDEDIVRVRAVRLVSAIIARAPADPATASDGEAAFLAKR